ncbi:helix-turn-helix transcriptional regulator [Petroclostridium sp. X23]|uniref:helix-turn-helix domain-containing protein n=1 Tax=Petroclostridium sp. X23 TaxID=3045146 RepID=UPI0024AD7677|nr:helix-turn-helix transcriptional regulator [Petroclostridium sp. X23]WHH60553.1 helix-turn-helix transcriptional regulator [Petroclostridium sp. X23]
MEILDYDILGKKIRKERKRINLSIEKLAELCHLSSSYMGLIERGQRGISLETLCRLSVIFNVSTDYLLFSDKDMKACENTYSCNILYQEILSLTKQYSRKDLEFLVEFIKLKNRYDA